MGPGAMGARGSEGGGRPAFETSRDCCAGHSSCICYKAAVDLTSLGRMYSHAQLRSPQVCDPQSLDEAGMWVLRARPLWNSLHANVSGTTVFAMSGGARRQWLRQMGGFELRRQMSRQHTWERSVVRLRDFELFCFA